MIRFPQLKQKQLKYFWNHRCDSDCMQNQIFDLSESSVVAAFIDKSHIFLMNCCDSKAVLFQDGKVVMTTNDMNVVPFGFSDFKFNPGISFSLLKRFSCHVFRFQRVCLSGSFETPTSRKRPISHSGLHNNLVKNHRRRNASIDIRIIFGQRE